MAKNTNDAMRLRGFAIKWWGRRQTKFVGCLPCIYMYIYIKYFGWVKTNVFKYKIGQRCKTGIRRFKLGTAGK